MVPGSVGIDLKELRVSAAEMFEILPRDWNLKPFFTQKWVSVDMNWGTPRQFQPWYQVSTAVTPSRPSLGSSSVSAN